MLSRERSILKVRKRFPGIAWDCGLTYGRLLEFLFCIRAFVYAQPGDYYVLIIYCGAENLRLPSLIDFYLGPF